MGKKKEDQSETTPTAATPKMVAHPSHVRVLGTSERYKVGGGVPGDGFGQNFASGDQQVEKLTLCIYDNRPAELAVTFANGDIKLLVNCPLECLFTDNRKAEPEEETMLQRHAREHRERMARQSEAEMEGMTPSRTAPTSEPVEPSEAEIDPANDSEDEPPDFGKEL